MTFILRNKRPHLFLDSLFHLSPRPAYYSTAPSPTTTTTTSAEELWDQLLIWEDALSSNNHRRYATKRSFNSSSHRMTSNDKEFHWSLDLPGVQASDLHIQVQDDGKLSIEGARRIFDTRHDDCSPMKKQRFSYILPLDPQKADASKVQANLADGVLVITAPKVPEAQPITIPITSEPHKQEKEEEEEEEDIENKTKEPGDEDAAVEAAAHVFSLDLPGVKVEDLNIEYKDGRLSIQGSRRHPELGQGTKKHVFSHTRVFHDHGQEIDSTKLTANLADGVLVITAPKTKKMAPKEKPYVAIHVTTEPHKEEKDMKEPVEKTTNEKNSEQVEKADISKEDESPKVEKQ
jgi:HSP20 family molecular chaperone IbpA